jgi:hypothetical protein
LRWSPLPTRRQQSLRGTPFLAWRLQPDPVEIFIARTARKVVVGKPGKQSGKALPVFFKTAFCWLLQLSIQYPLSLISFSLLHSSGRLRVRIPRGNAHAGAFMICPKHLFLWKANKQFLE